MPLIDEWNSQIQEIYSQHLKKISFDEVYMYFLEPDFSLVLNKCLILL